MISEGIVPMIYETPLAVNADACVRVARMLPSKFTAPVKESGDTLRLLGMLDFAFSYFCLLLITFACQHVAAMYVWHEEQVWPK